MKKKKSKKKPTKTNLIGKKFGRLTIIEKATNVNKSKSKPHGYTAFLCLCECGNENIVRSDRLKDGITKSCGCLHNPYTPKEASARKIWQKSYNDGNLTFEQFMILSQQNCFYCDAILSNKQNVHKHSKDSSQYAKDNGDFAYNGLDRIDSNLPHNIENCVPCCWRCNSMKSDMSQSEFKKQIIRIYKHFGRK